MRNTKEEGRKCMDRGTRGKNSTNAHRHYQMGEREKRGAKKWRPHLPPHLRREIENFAKANEDASEATGKGLVGTSEKISAQCTLS